jgi:hypothetical protein
MLLLVNPVLARHFRSYFRSCGTPLSAEFEAAHDLGVDLYRGSQLADLFLQDVAFVEKGSDLSAHSLFKGSVRSGGAGVGSQRISGVYHGLTLSQSYRKHDKRTVKVR